MRSPKGPDDIEIAPNHTVGEWKKLKLDVNSPATSDWKSAIEIFKARIVGRFFEPADRLIEFETGKSRGTFGFAVLAIDFLIIETLRGFREGVGRHVGNSERLFKAFLTDWTAFTSCLSVSDVPETRAKDLYKQGRCALHHSGSTDHIIVKKSGPMLSFQAGNQIVINRTAFHKSLRLEFDRYVAELAVVGNAVLRTNFKSKMQHIVIG